jgi:hypothetical protein
LFFHRACLGGFGESFPREMTGYLPPASTKYITTAHVL